MNVRINTYNKTKQELRDALNRLIKGEPTSLELRKKLQAGKLKINAYSVEKEADKSTGVLRNHDDVRTEIISAETAKKTGNTELETNINIALYEQNNKTLKETRAKMRANTELHAKTREELARKEAALAKKKGKMVELIIAMAKEIPRGIVREKLVKTSHPSMSDVIPLKR